MADTLRLEPIDYDPFDSGQPTGSLRLEPVDFDPFATDAGWAGMPKEVGKGIARGAVSATGTAMTGLSAAGARDPAEEQAYSGLLADLPRVKDMDARQYADFVKRATTGVRGGNEMNILAIASQIRSGKMDPADIPQDLLDVLPKQNIEDTKLFQAGQATKQFGEDKFAAAPDYKETWTAAISEGLGSTAPFIAVSIVPGVGAALSTAAGVSMGQGEAIERAQGAGATREQVMEAGRLGAAPGLTEQIPIETLLDRIPLPVAGRFGQILGKVLSQAAAEGGQEAVQQTLQNVIANYTYNPDQDLTEGVLEAATVGGIVGGIMGGAAAPFERRGGPAPAPSADTVDQVPAGAVPAERLLGAEEGGAGASPVPLSPATPSPAPAQAPVFMPAAPYTPAPQKLPDKPQAPSVDAVAPIPADPDPVRADSPRLTPEDRASPLPNSLIDDGKAIISTVLGVPDGTIGAQRQPDGEPTPGDPVGISPTGEPQITTPPEAGAPLPGISADPEPIPGNPRSDPEKRVLPRIEARTFKEDEIQTPTGKRFKAAYAIVDLDSLVPSNFDDGRINPAYPQERQPRDRTKGTYESQYREIIAKFDPRQLDQSPTSDNGAPIVDETGVVESGNGRIITLARIYRDRPDLAQKYIDHMAAQGYPLPNAADKTIRKPVLVRVRTTPMSEQEIAEYTRASNVRTSAEMSDTEQAMADAGSLQDFALELYRGGDIDSAQNRDFVRAFMAAAVAKQEHGKIVDDATGEFSQAGIRRIRAALIAKAYGDSSLVASLFESQESEIKAIGNALLFVSAKWAQMRAKARSGQIDPRADLTNDLLEAVRTVSRARREGRKLFELVNQRDVFSGVAMSAEAEAFLRVMFRDTENWTRPVSQDKLAEALDFYVTQAMETKPGVDIFGEAGPVPTQILATAKQKQEKAYAGTAEQQTGLDFAAPRPADPGRDLRPASPVRTEPAMESGEGPRGADPSQESERPAGEVKPKGAKSPDKAATVATDKSIGTNAKGQPIYEDENGVRSYSSGGVMITEPVEMIPVREGGYRAGVNPSRRGDEFKTEAERAPETSAADEFKGFKVGDLVDVPSRTTGRSEIVKLYQKNILGDRMTPMAQIRYGSEGKTLDLILAELRKVEPKAKAPEATEPEKLDNPPEKEGGYPTYEPADIADAETRLLQSQYTSNKAVKLEDGRAWRIKKDGDGFIVLRLPDKNGMPVRYIRPDTGLPWTAGAAVGEALRQAKELAGKKEQAPEPAKAPEATESEKPADLSTKPAVSANTIFTEDAAEKARRLIREKLKGQLNSGIDPELMQAGLTLAGYHIEKGARTFAAYAKAMVEDLGPGIKPYLKSWYMGVKYDPRATTLEGMSSAAEVEAYQFKDEGDVEPQDAGRNDQPGDARDEPGQDGADEDAGDVGSVQGEPDRGVRVDDRREPANDPEPQASVGQAEPETGTGAQQPVSGSRPASARPAKRKNYRIEPGELKRPGSWFTTAEQNVTIVELVKSIIAEGREATAEERALLTQYTGWGASEIANGVFPNQYGRYKDDRWKGLGERLKAALTEEEYAQAQRTTQYAHYTSEPIIRSVFNALERMGFAGGSVLEPGMGIGLFNGLMPDAMANKSNYTGIEYDTITGNIAKLLYPDSNIIVGDYSKTALPKDFFDAAIGNPPFGQIKITSDQEYRKQSFLLHDYFFAKTIDRVKPGGLLVFVTSKGTMDKSSDRARKYLAERADLIGAVRLPQTAFKENAGTEVVTDVIFLQKRMPGQESGGQEWAKSLPLELDKGTAYVNEYFLANPRMVLGRHAMTGSMYRANEYTVEPLAGDIEELFAAAIANLPENIYRPDKGGRAQASAVIKRDYDPKVKKEGGIYVADDGTLMQVEAGSGVPLTQRPKSDGGLTDLKPREITWLKGYVKVRDALKQAQYDQLNEGDWEKSLKALNTAYDQFVAKNGKILDHTVSERENENGESIITLRFKNQALIRLDAEGALSYTIEHILTNGQIVKGPALLGRVLNKPSTPKVETTNDALFVSLNEIGKLDIEAVAALAKKTVPETIAELGTLIYKDPEGGWQTRDAYLSGDVRKKLRTAIAAVRVNKDYERNVEALEAVQPKPLAPADITVQLGANWVPGTDIANFAAETFQTRVTAKYSTITGRWVLDGYTGDAQWSVANWTTTDILQAVMNNAQLKVEVRDRDGKTYVDADSTEKLNDIARKMRDEFKRWIWTDPNRAERLAKYYNENFNNIAPREYDGSHLTLPGVSTRYDLRPHQKRAIWRTIQDGDTYYAHAVGAGKTFTMIASGMEERRLGLSKKPMFVVPNHMLAQFSKEFLELYPTAQIMVADEENFHTHNRRKFVAQAALNDPDAIVITHSAFGRIGMSQSFQQKFINDQIDEWTEALADVDKSDRVTVKQIQRKIQQLEQRLEKLIKTPKDQVLDFEELGVDRLFVDEGHEFRKLDFPTLRGSIKGIDSSGSQRAADLFMKVKYLRQKKPTRSLVMASGTPVTNTMGELFTVQRYFQPKQLAEDGSEYFDAWSVQFGDVVTGLEQNAAGGWEPVARFAKFVNVPELMARVRSFMDILTSQQLGDLVVRPDVRGGGREVVITPAPDGFKDYQKSLDARIKAIRARSGPPVKGDDIILSVIGDGRFSAIDMRFVKPEWPSDEKSKLNRMLDDVIEAYNSTTENTYETDGVTDPLKGSSIMVFTDIGLGEQSARSRGFDMKEWIERRLVAGGVRREHIAFMRDNKLHSKKEKLFNDMRQGRKRILIGGKDMETGVNAQKRLTHLFHLDAPWFPASVEQREGRIIRQGNQNKEVVVRAYATKGSYDSTMWSMNARKARFIEQAMNGDSSVRSLEDVSEASAFEMAAALASGDERYMKLAGLRGEVERLNRLYSAHETQQKQFRSEIAKRTDDINYFTTRVKAVEAAIKERKPIEAGKFEGYVGDTRYESRQEFSEAIFAAFKERAEGFKQAQAVLGKIGGFDIIYNGTRKGADFEADLSIDLPTNPDPLAVFPIDPAGSVAGIATRAANQVNGLDESLARYKQIVEDNEQRLARVQKAVGKPFPEQTEYNEKTAELAELEAELDAESKAAKAAEAGQQAAPEASLSLDQGKFVGTTKDGNTVESRPVKFGETKAALLADSDPNGESDPALANELRREFERLGVPDTMLNIVERMSVAYRDGKKIKEFGVNGAFLENVIVVALKGQHPVATLHHETLHALKELGAFTQAEWAALERRARDVWVSKYNIRTRYPSLTTEKTLEEAIAHAYTSFVETRRGEAGIFRKLMQRIESIFEAIRAVFKRNGITKAEQIEPIFDALFAGKVGRRLSPSSPLRQAAGASAMLETDQTETDAFKRWFGKSVMQDEGKPIVMYHSTHKEFDTFDRTASRGWRSEKWWNSIDEIGSWFSDEKEQTRYGPKSVPVYLKIERPLYVDDESIDDSEAGKPTFGVDDVFTKLHRLVKEAGGAEQFREALRRDGHDGVVLQGWLDKYRGMTAVALDPNQIKSVDNRGTFDPDSPSIMLEVSQEPRTVEDGKRLMLGFISAGQPIDSALRLPFAVFGGIDKDGRWNWGKKLTAASRKALVEKKFKGDNAASAWTNGIIEKARAGLIDRYGLSQEYIRTERERALDERAILEEGEEFLKLIQSQSVTPDEAKVLQALLTGENIDNERLKNLSAPIIAAIDDLGNQAVELGLISRSSYERNKGAYLHRAYMKHETGKNGLVRLNDAMSGAWRKRIIGSELKGRGIFLKVSLDKLMRQSEEWVGGRKGDPVIGDKFRVVDEISPQKDSDKPDAKPKVIRRIYLPPEKGIPTRYSGPAFVDQGIWEVRGKAGKEYTVWRDYTKAERTSMGEILDARYNIAKTYLLMANDLANGKFFKKIAENEEWSRSAVEEGRWRNPQDRDAGQEWVKVPETEISGTGGKKRYGAIAGRYVRPEIWRDIAELERMQSPGTWRALLTQWKLNKTARNPVVHMNNIMSNIVLADMMDVTAADIVRGIKAYASKDQMYQDAVKHGALGVDMISQEIRDKHLRPLLEKLVNESEGATSWQDRASIIGRLAQIWDVVAKLDETMMNAYRMEDDIFRMGLFVKRRRAGDDAFTAADAARTQFIDYDIRAPWVNAARNSFLPFIGYTYRAVPLVAQAIVERPWKLAKYATLAYVANALAYAALGLDDDDEQRERASLRDQEQGFTWLGSPRLIRLPWQDANGLPMFIDIRRWIPAGDVFDTGQGSAVVPVPAPIMFGGPLMLAAELALNKSAFTGDEIRGEYDTLWEKYQKTADYTFKAFAPSAPWVPNSWYWDKIANALGGATDNMGRAYSLPQAILSSVGIKVRPQDVEQGLYWRGVDIRREGADLKSQARTLARQRERNLISQESYESKLSIIVLKAERLKERASELGEIADQ